MENVTKYIVDGETWYKGKDVANVVGYTNHRKAFKDHVANIDKLTLRCIRKNPRSFYSRSYLTYPKQTYLTYTTLR